MSDLILRVIALCIVLAGVETLHGIARAALLVPRIGKRRALRVSIVTGSLLAFAVCYLLVPPLGLTGTGALLLLGLVLALFMASFDLLLGMTLLRRSWRKARADLDPRSGNYLLYGLLALVFFPWLVMRL